ncbi:winged helix-turn-helix domain-containing protein [Tsuneonella sp. HG222]
MAGALPPMGGAVMIDQPHIAVQHLPRGELALGSVLVSPALRCMTGPGGRTVLEPRMMQVLLLLAERPGQLVTRGELAARCWSGVAVGDDSINRAIAGIRRAARQAGPDAFRIETVSGSGYALVVQHGGGARALPDAGDAAGEAVQAAWRTWRLGLPAVNPSDLDALRGACRLDPARAEAWGMLALLLRHAVEYADGPDCAALVAECEETAARALALAPGQPEALAALAGLWPIFGDWKRRRAVLLGALKRNPGSAPLRHDLLVLEMSTGRPAAALAVLEPLFRADGLAAIYHYKMIYQLWTVGRVEDAVRVADAAMQMWPRHPAIWFCCFWLLCFTGRAVQARQQLHDEVNRPPIPPVALGHLEATVRALVDPSTELRGAAVAANLSAAERGPAQSVQALIQLSGMGELDAAFEVARAYFLRAGSLPVGIRKSASDPTVNELHRRATQCLFIPTAAAMRADPRFEPLCEAMGLAGYWRACGIEPDFRAEPAGNR